MEARFSRINNVLLVFLMYMYRLVLVLSPWIAVFHLQEDLIEEVLKR